MLYNLISKTGKGEDEMPNEEILLMRDLIVRQLSPVQVYLFGSYAYGTPSHDSDYDFYIVVDDDKTDWHEQTVQAYKAIRPIRTKPVDILVGTKSDFEKRKRYSSIEREVAQKGVLIYG